MHSNASRYDRNPRSANVLYGRLEIALDPLHDGQFIEEIVSAISEDEGLYSCEYYSIYDTLRFHEPYTW